MSNEKKTPSKCNHCNSTNIIHHVWNRLEYWSCKDCKQEVTYVEPKLDLGLGGIAWDPKIYGWGSTDLKSDIFSIDKSTYKNWKNGGALPPGSIVSVPPTFPSIANNYNDDGGYGDDGF